MVGVDMAHMPADLVEAFSPTSLTSTSNKVEFLGSLYMELKKPIEWPSTLVSEVITNPF